MIKIDAIVLAGSKNTGKLQEVSSASYEALIPLANKPMIVYVLEALRSCDRVGKVVVVGPRELKAYLEEGETLVESKEYLSTNLQLGIRAVNKKRRVLIVTSDIPMLNAEVVEDFLARCERVDADLYYPVVSREVSERAFPGVERTYIRVKEGSFTGGNIFLVSPELVRNSKELVDKALHLRKKPLKLAYMLGLGFILRFIMRRVTFAEVEARAKKVFNVNGIAIITPFVELGVDVDKPSDYALMNQFFLAQKNAEEESAE